MMQVMIIQDGGDVAMVGIQMFGNDNGGGSHMVIYSLVILKVNSCMIRIFQFISLWVLHS